MRPEEAVMERVEGIEPSSPAWKADDKNYLIIDLYSIFYETFLKIQFGQPVNN